MVFDESIYTVHIGIDNVGIDSWVLNYIITYKLMTAIKL